MADEILSRDNNHVPVAGAITDNAAEDVKMWRIDDTTKGIKVVIAGGVGTGDVVGPASSTDNAVARFDGTTGKTIQNSAVIIADTTGNISGTQKVTVGVAGSATGSIEIKGTTSGTVTLKTADAAGTYTLTLPTNDGDAGQVLTTDGAGVTTWETNAATGANTALSNLASVALNTALLPDAAAADDFGSATLPFKDIFLAGSSGTPGTNNFRLTGASTSGTRVITFPDATGTLLYDGGALGTPSSGVATNLTGTASGLTAGTVTTNANLTGAVTSVGNATSLGSFNLAALNTALSDADVATGGGTVTGASSGTNTGDQTSIVGITGTIAQFNTAVTDADFATLAGTEELDNKTLDSSVGKGTWTASGTWTLPAITAGGNITLAENSSIALDPAGSADGKYSGTTVTGTGGTTIAFGDLIYLDPTDSRWELADANAAAGADGDSRGILGIAVTTSTDGNPVTVLLHGIVRADAVFPALTINGPVYVSETAGDIVVAQPTTTDAVIRVVGFALTADEIFFNPSGDYITHT